MGMPDSVRDAVPLPEKEQKKPPGSEATHSRRTVCLFFAFSYAIPR